jgi:hypothetical protein
MMMLEGLMSRCDDAILVGKSARRATGMTRTTSFIEALVAVSSLQFASSTNSMAMNTVPSSLRAFRRSHDVGVVEATCGLRLAPRAGEDFIDPGAIELVAAHGFSAARR